MFHCAVKKSEDNYSLIVKNSNVPVVGSNDVLIKVAFAGVNRADIYQAQGLYKAPESASDVLGLEISGEVIEIGSKVKSCSVGDKVCALLQGGGYAEFVSVPEWRVLNVPNGMMMDQAAVLPEAIFTVYFNLFHLAKLKPSDIALIHGGSSGIGHIAIQAIKAMGGKVYTTVGSSEKKEFCESLGVDLAINYKEADFVEETLAKKPEGVAVVLDIVGGDYFQKNIKLLKKGGKLVQIGFVKSPKAEVNFAPMLLKQLTLMGSTLRSQKEEVIYDLAQSIRSLIWPMIENGKIIPFIDEIFKLEDAKLAHEKMENFQHKGKLVLEVAV